MVNAFYAKKNQYLLLYPANDGYSTCPFEWWGTFCGKDQKIMDNQHAFKEITNLSDIISQMAKLYARYIDDYVFISAYNFAVRLNENPVPDYYGKASLILTDKVIQNSNVNSEQRNAAKKYFINQFLDRYIGWNFGVVIENNPDLEKALNELNNLAIAKGIRIKDTGLRFDVWDSKDVKHYRFKGA